MSIFSDISNLSNKKRKLEVPAPDTKLLVRGMCCWHWDFSEPQSIQLRI